MPRARKHIVCLSNTPYYHVSSRCVRRAFLCGVDAQTGKSYEHRRGWIEDRVRVLSSLFSIEICAYAVMSNHYHLAVRIDVEEPRGWSDDEVLRRWTALFRGPLLVQRYRSGEALTPVEHDSLRSMTAVYRKRLGNLSWFMKCLNEPIARRANAEDDCTGHFWEARFDSQPLISERALLAAMAYVDLNPVRAKIASKPENSAYTSLKARLDTRQGDDVLSGAVARLLRRGELAHFDGPIRPLMPFADAADVPGRKSPTLPMYELEYYKLVDATSRFIAPGKRGRIDPSLAPMLERLGISEEQWLQASSAFRQHFRKGDIRTRLTA